MESHPTAEYPVLITSTKHRFQRYTAEVYTLEGVKVKKFFRFGKALSWAVNIQR